ncbi:MAG: hypothetical protein ABF306_16355 [Nocardioides marinisabuli]|uniref:hypothetical protein n=1 Tax=Nocardioides marinisabuli TaxID=419476 RepID=UPI00321A4BAA
MIYLFMLLSGTAAAGFNTWQRRGRSSAARRWARGTHRDFAQRNVLVLWPLLAAALLLGAALGGLQRAGGPTTPVALLLGLVLVAWVGFAALPLPVPSAVQPRWYRDRPTSPDGRSRD